MRALKGCFNLKSEKGLRVGEILKIKKCRE